jgi:diacylglycerol kinase family enzyme
MLRGTMLRAALIVNPKASAVTPERTEAVARALGRSAAIETLLTERPGHAAELAEALTDVDAIFVFSGDGGFNETLNGVRGEVPVGFVPGGGANVLPRLLDLPGDPVRAAGRLSDALASGRTRPFSLGRANGRRFAFSAGVGLDAEVVRRIDRRGRSAEGRRPGNLAFALEVVRLVLERRGRFPEVLEVEGLGRAAFALVVNAPAFTYAGPVPLRVSAHARPELGLDLAAPGAVAPLGVLPLLGALVRGRGGNVLRLHDADRIVIRCDRPQPLQADGEDLGDVTEAVFVAERDAVRVLV